MKRFLALAIVALLLAGCAQNTATTEPSQAEVILLPEVTVPVPTAKTVTINEEGLTDEEILAQRRDIVEAEMRSMMGMLWTPAEDIRIPLLWL